MESPAYGRFRAWFEWLGISQGELAKRLKCDQPTVSRLLAGKRRVSVDVGLAIERESSKWPRGPIRVREWTRAGTKAA